jgi:hypothetical protein
MAKRYRIVVSVQDNEKGEYVLYEDYARLKAEVDRLDTLCKQVMAQHSDISCENIMLRKAGDEMLSEWASGDEKDAQNFLKALVIWNAAKEGKGYA